MKPQNILILITATLFISVVFTSARKSDNTTKHTLIVEVLGIKKNQGNIRLALFNSEKNYGKEGENYKKAVKSIEIKAKVPKIIIRIDGIDYGKYAISLFQDINGNEVIDKNFFGVPEEPYGFSNNPSTTFSAPSFEEVVFDFKENNAKVKITLKD